MTRLPYKFDTNAVRVEVALGGTAGELYVVEEGIHAVDIILDEPLQPGDEAVLEYSTFFNYRELPPPMFRRAVGSRVMEELDITVTFDERQLPLTVWQAEWNGYAKDSLIVTEEQVQPTPLELEEEAGMRVWLHHENVSNSVIGFRWEWPQGVIEQ